MNTPAPFPGHSSALKLARRPAPAPVAGPATGGEMSGQLAADFEALREREMNLRDYEARLRAWQAQLDEAGVKPTAVAGSAGPGGTGSPFPRTTSGSPFVADATVQAAWEKFYRARALLEAEQNQMREDRIVLRETEVSLQRREAELARREAALAEREQLLMAAVQRTSPSAVQRLTQAPFVAAKAIFSSRK